MKTITSVLALVILVSCTKSVAIEQPGAVPSQLQRMISFLDSNAVRVPLNAGAIRWDVYQIQFDGRAILTQGIHWFTNAPSYAVPSFGQWEGHMARMIEFQQFAWCQADDYWPFRSKVTIYGSAERCFVWNNAPLQFAQNHAYTFLDPGYIWGPPPTTVTIYLVK